jgi:hypothetical protein
MPVSSVKKSLLAVVALMFLASAAKSEEAVLSTVAANTYRIDGTHSIISTINCPISAKHTPVTLTYRQGFIRITFLQTAKQVWCDAAVAPKAPRVRTLLLIKAPRKHHQQHQWKHNREARSWAAMNQYGMRHARMRLNRYKPARQRFVVVIER